MGDGQQIYIWEDSWIPSSPDGKILTPKGNCLLRNVQDLIDPISGMWDEDLIRSIFWDVDVNQISTIPLSQSGMNDFVA